ncbi:MAG: EAL domain-containing protein [Aliivibrio sp.]|uniref:putative bifunctional diguanylate cyclase/phosphodiesterase n=1 Tax=Aliivibrio sp. TaxID=1872443 RepID=UPI001A3E3A01|nr:EAL domain-containing protein [Aliivibrio sp.]
MINDKALNTSKRVVILTSVLILLLSIWQTFSANKIHQRYQASLMDAVTDRILSDYQEYFTQLRLEIDLFQQKQFNAIESLQKSGDSASEEKYMEVLTSLRSEIKNTRLFALIDEEGKGSLKHITGDFLPACEEEVSAMVASGKQEQLFLHRSGTSVHFDLLQPLSTANGKKEYFFVAFNPDVLNNLLNKYQLPYQQLFLMRADQTGEIELTTEDKNSDYASMFIGDAELSEFSFVKAIPNTRWQLAIRLDSQYSSSLYQQGLLKALIIWLVLTSIIYGFYRLQKVRAHSHFKVKQELMFKDTHDTLTGLVNRLHFDSLLKVQLQQNQKNEAVRNGVVLHIDIDNFQMINNSFGYAIGDNYLYKASAGLKDTLPSDAIISRLGSDEFAILLPSLDFAQASDFANKIRLFFQEISISALNEDVSLTASIGVVILDNSQFETEQVFSSLSQAVSLAKKKGRNRVQVYQSNDEQLIHHAREMLVIHEISQALKTNRLVLYRQQIKSMNSHLSSHYEVLVRMISSDGELIAPNNFIPAAEKYGVIRQIDHWVIENTFKKMLENKADTTTCYSINLSGLTLADLDIYDQVIALFERYKIAPQRICFEVTETSAITHLESALHFMESMITFGCSFSLDDFGSGLSSFSYLQKLPVATIKIDGSFVRDMHCNEVNRIFVENIKRTAAAMNKKTVAEFVENAEIEQLLVEIGIDYGQGYHIHKPEPWVTVPVVQ